MEKELQLQPRLQCIASLVPQGARLADVGTDHGYLPVWLLQHGRIESAIASDINALPLDHARATAREYGVTERMDFRLCPGLAKIKAEECDAIAIAGMGALLAASVRAPLTGIVLVLEMTDNYQLILPMIITCLGATLLAQFLGGKPLYSTILQRTLAKQEAEQAAKAQQAPRENT